MKASLKFPAKPECQIINFQLFSAQNAFFLQIFWQNIQYSPMDAPQVTPCDMRYMQTKIQTLQIRCSQFQACRGIIVRSIV